MPENDTKKYQSFTGKLRVLEQEAPFLFKVEIFLLNALVNRNNWQYLNLAEHKDLFVDTPVLVAYTNGGSKVGDGHNFKMRRGQDGKQYASFTDPTAERIVGWIRDKEDIRIENVDGTDWIIATAYVWAWYAKELTDMLSEQGSEGMDVSIETLIEEMHMDGDTEVYDKYVILGTTILGKGVSPAVAGAHIRALSYKEGLEELKVRVAAYEDAKKHTKTEKRSIRRMNKHQLAEVQAKFPDHRVLAASDDGMRVALLSKDGRACSYAFAENETTVVPERIKYCNATISFEMGEDEEPVLLSANELAESFLSENEALSVSLNEAVTARQAAEERLNGMIEAENKRRVKAAADAVKAKFLEFNSGVAADERADEALLCDFVTRAESGAYTDCLNEQGEWNGDERACSELLAKATEKMLSVKREKAARENASKTIAWDRVKSNANSGTGIEGLLGRVNK